MQEYNEIKWAEDVMVPSRELAKEQYRALMLEEDIEHYRQIVEHKDMLLKEANEYISRLEQSVEFWKQQHKEACEDYVYWKDRCEALEK